MPEIRLIGLDLDGTLLRKDNSVSDENISALQECIKQNIQIYLISGRPYCFTRMIAEKIHPSVRVISSNGAIYEIGTKCIMHTIEPHVLYQIIDVLKEHAHAHAFFKGKHEFFTHEPYDERFLYDHINNQLPAAVQVTFFTGMSWEELKHHAHDIAKILVYDMQTERLLKARKQIECIENITVTDYQPISFDITAGGVHKGNAIKAVLQSLHLKKEEFMAFGDAMNDLPMFAEAGLTVAMANAAEEIQASCDIVTADYMDDGVAKAIQRYIL